MHHEIESKWQSLGGADSFLGHPTGSEGMCPDKEGAFAHFENGSIHWHPSCGAHETHGAINKAWAKTGWECGELGYPVSDEQPISEFGIYILTNENAKGRSEEEIKDQMVEARQSSEHSTGIPSGSHALSLMSTDPSSGRISKFQKGGTKKTSGLDL